MAKPVIEPAIGNGFNHLKLANDDIHFQYKIHGLEMDWQIFKPIFLCPSDAAAYNDLARLSIWGWQSQAVLASQNIGMMSVGLEKVHCQQRGGGSRYN